LGENKFGRDNFKGKGVVDKDGSLVELLKVTIKFSGVEMKPGFLVATDILMPMKGMGQFHDRWQGHAHKQQDQSG
jgi:hypothetical protein